MRDPSDAEDIALVEKFLAGDQRAFESLFDKYREKVHRIAFRFVHNRDDALEVTQDVFLRVYQNLARFKTDSKFFTWLYRVTANRAIDFTRSAKSRPIRGADSSLLEEHEYEAGAKRSTMDPVERAQEKELGEEIARAVNLLSDKHRAVFLLHAQEDLSYKEIAQVVECSIGTVMSRLFYARKKLQELLTERGVERRKRAGRTGSG